MLQSLLDNAVYKVISETLGTMREEATATLVNADPNTKATDIARAQGRIEMLNLFTPNQLKDFERLATERSKKTPKLTDHELEENENDDSAY